MSECDPRSAPLYHRDLSRCHIYILYTRHLPQPHLKQHCIYSLSITHLASTCLFLYLSFHCWCRLCSTSLCKTLHVLTCGYRCIWQPTCVILNVSPYLCAKSDGGYGLMLKQEPLLGLFCYLEKVMFCIFSWILLLLGLSVQASFLSEAIGKSNNTSMHLHLICKLKTIMVIIPLLQPGEDKR